MFQIPYETKFKVKNIVTERIFNEFYHKTHPFPTRLNGESETENTLFTSTLRMSIVVASKLT